MLNECSIIITRVASINLLDGMVYHGVGVAPTSNLRTLVPIFSTQLQLWIASNDTSSIILTSVK